MHMALDSGKSFFRRTFVAILFQICTLVRLSTRSRVSMMIASCSRASIGSHPASATV